MAPTRCVMPLLTGAVFSTKTCTSKTATDNIVTR